MDDSFTTAIKYEIFEASNLETLYGSVVLVAILCTC